MRLQQPTRLQCTVKHYAWGRPGGAELWMGTHLNGPSRVASPNTDTLLSEYLPDGGLCFLFKILSVNTALSIQAHPDAELARRLHAERPESYHDSNHKPEMAIAVSVFEMMCGFRPADQIATFLRTVPELRHLVGTDVADAFVADATQEKLRAVFVRLMKSDPRDVRTHLALLIQRLERDTRFALRTSHDLEIGSLLTRLNQQYPGDVGVFCPFFLNSFRLEPGEAVFIKSGVPHAYLSGECVEAMACSDNVVRAGLTLKERDVATLCDMLTYETGMPDIMLGTQLDAFTHVFAPPVREFIVWRTCVPTDVPPYVLRGTHSDAVLVAYSGSGELRWNTNIVNIESGMVFFMPAELDTIVMTRGQEDLVLFRCAERKD